jgi:hypothetical protein
MTLIGRSARRLGLRRRQRRVGQIDIDFFVGDAPHGISS